MAKQEAKIIVTDINQADCQKVIDEIKTFHGEAIALKFNVTDKSEVDSAVVANIASDLAGRTYCIKIIFKVAY